MRLLQPAAKVFYGIYKQRLSTRRWQHMPTDAVKWQVNWIKPHLHEKKETEYGRLIYSLYTPENIYSLETAKNTYTSWINVCEETLCRNWNCKRLQWQNKWVRALEMLNVSLCFQFIRYDCVYINIIINKISRFLICARIVLYSGLRMNLFNKKKEIKNSNLNASIQLEYNESLKNL